jgi:vacuolar-type H+-ATPase subunit E/Vma4
MHTFAKPHKPTRNQSFAKECNFSSALDYQPNEKYIMELIRQNPYHVIGILAGANQRTIAKQKAKINAFQKVGKSIEFDTDLEFTGNPDRSNGALEKAFANIEINQNKLFNALFWFANNNHLDETALNYLQSGDLEKAEEIWQKVTTGKEVSSKNFTAYNNLGSLKLATAFNNGTIDVESLKEAVRLKTELLTSDNFNDFCHLVADETYTVDQDKELEIFVNALLEEVNKSKNTEAKKIPAQIGSIHPKIKSLVSEKLTDTPLHNIERKTEQTKKKRADSPEDGLDLARKLYRDTKSDLTTLFELLGKTDLKYKMVADKLAKELLQCGIDYFKEYQDREEEHGSGGIPQEHSQYAGSTGSTDDLGTSVMKLFKTAKTIAVGTQTKERITENIDGLQEWIDNADEREKQKLIGEDLAFVASKLERFQSLEDTIENADDLVTSCNPKLQNMKGSLGAYDDFYLKISSAVVNNAQGMLVTVINEAQQDPLIKAGLLDGLQNKVRGAIKVSDKLGTLDMVPELKEQYNKNHRTLKSISSQIGASGSRQSTTGTSSNSNSSDNTGCLVFIGIAVVIGIIIALANSNDNSSDDYSNYSSPSYEDKSNNDNDYDYSSGNSLTNEPIKESAYKGNQLKNGTSPYDQASAKVFITTIIIIG